MGIVKDAPDASIRPPTEGHAWLTGGRKRR
jgi:hypothetical protein